jgi:hypothetical protein
MTSPIFVPSDALVGVLELMRDLTPEQQKAVLQILAQEFLGEDLQVCGWCYTGYPTAAEAGACARTCRAARAHAGLGLPCEVCQGACTLDE